MFSVIIPTFNRVHTIQRAIQSVLNQTYCNFELIVVDDGSTDNTQFTVSSFDDSRIRYIHKENQGVSSARNTGAVAANGQFIIFLDSDDEALPEWLTCFQEVFSDPQIGLVSCGFFWHEDGANKRNTVVLPQNLGPLYCNQTGLFIAGTFAVRRDIYLAVGGYVEELTHSENTELGFRLTEFCVEQGWAIASIAKPLVIYYRQTSGGAREAHHLQKHLKSSEYILAHHADRLRRVPKVYGYYLAIGGVRAAKLGDYAKARRFFRQAIQAHPVNFRHYGRYFLSLFPSLGRQLWAESSQHITPSLT